MNPRAEQPKGIISVIDRAVASLSTAAGALSVLVLAGMVMLVVLEMILRAVFSTSTYIATEFVGYGVGAITFLSLSDAFRSGSHIRVSLLIGKMRGIGRRIVESICTIAALYVSSFLAWYFWQRIARDLVRGTTSTGAIEVPMWIPKGVLLVGLLLFVIVLAMHLLKAVCGQDELVDKQQVPREDL